MGHQCKNKQLQVLPVKEDDAEKGGEADEWEHDQPMLSNVAKLSINSIVRISTPRTMKLHKDIYGARNCFFY